MEKIIAQIEPRIGQYVQHVTFHPEAHYSYGVIREIKDGIIFWFDRNAFDGFGCMCETKIEAFGHSLTPY